VSALEVSALYKLLTYLLLIVLYVRNIELMVLSYWCRTVLIFYIKNRS